MGAKEFSLSDGGTVKIYKRRGARSLRLSVTPEGMPRVTIPAWAPYSAGLSFAEQRLEWIRAQQPIRQLLINGQAIGKAHRLRFEAVSAATVTTRVKATEIIVSHPRDLAIHHQEVQAAASKAGIRALRAQAVRLLPQRLSSLAEAHDITYRSVRIKQLRSRWGSCDQDRNIVLSLYLMQLPWSLIDYVLLHELAHTQVMQHGPRFWAALETLEPRAKQLRKEIRAHRPVLGSSPADL